ncbi:MAG: spermidine/putrescine ABC transporter substrate-binding protein [Planctomycetota bacterium]|nr:spermidine/putrescine ABC transporter substrate-binding protein [Planctomycetota bacterium]
MRSLILSLFALFAFALGGCGSGGKTGTAAKSAGGPDAPSAGGIVSVFIWSEYHDPEVVAEFEKQTGLKVKLSYFESNEQMLAKLQQPGSDKEYDIVVPSAHSVASMIKLDMLLPLDHAKLPNLKHIAPRFRDAAHDPGNKYAAPYFWGTTGILYRKDKLKDPPRSWSAIFKEPAGTFALLDEMRDLLGSALVYQGKSSNSRNREELKAAAELLIQAKHSEKFRFLSSGTEAKDKVLAGEIDMTVNWNGEGVRAMKESEQVDFFIPEEGSVLWVDSLAIPKHAPNPDGAHKLIDWLCEPKHAARQATALGYGSPVAAALEHLSKEDRENPRIYPPEELMRKLQIQEELGADSQVWDELWTQIKSR